MASLQECTRIVQLKVRLSGISPMIWRRVLVPESGSPREVHGILQVSMGWMGFHLSYFDIYAVHVAWPAQRIWALELGVPTLYKVAL